MKVGDLVKVNRSSIGIPRGSVGLIVETKLTNHFTSKIQFHYVQLCGIKRSGLRYLERDLEVINASR